MTRVRFTTGFRSDLLRGIELPVEIRTSDSTLLRRLMSSESIDVEPGMYVVATKLPAGKEIKRVINVTDREMTVDLMPPQLRNTVMEVATFLASERGVLADVRAAAAKLKPHSRRLGALLGVASRMLNRDESLRILAGNPLDGPLTPADVELERTGGADNVVQYRVPPAARPLFLRSVQPSRPTVTFALPVSDRAGCVVAVHREPERVWVEVHVDHPEASLLLGYQQSKSGSEETALAERLLAGKLEDPIAATIGAYSLLRYGRLEHLHDWTANLAQWFPWLPDAAAIRGEHLARLGRHADALAAFVALPGLPMFSDGISYTWERIRLYQSVKTEFPPSVMARAKALHDKLAPFIGITNFDRVVTTFT
jgi:hypothetical protein